MRHGTKSPVRSLPSIIVAACTRTHPKTKHSTYAIANSTAKFEINGGTFLRRVSLETKVSPTGKQVIPPPFVPLQTFHQQKVLACPRTPRKLPHRRNQSPIKKEHTPKHIVSNLLLSYHRLYLHADPRILKSRTVVTMIPSIRRGCPHTQIINRTSPPQVSSSNSCSNKLHSS